jgi:hypothetical protein
MGSRRVRPTKSHGAYCHLTQSKDNSSVKASMDCNCKVESGINIGKLVVSDSSYRVNVVHASINTKSCRTSQYDDMKKRIVDKKSLMHVS